MPSPQLSTDSSLRPEQPLLDPRPDSAQHDSRVSDATADQNGEISSTERVSNGLVPDAIKEGKQNAKAVLEASGVSTTGAEFSSDNHPNGDFSSDPQSSANGSSSSRKRSHDGSVIQSSSKDDLPMRVRQTPVNKIQLEEYVNREFQYSALAAWHNYSQGLARQKRAERDYYLALRRENQMNPAALYGVGYEGFGNARTDLRNQHPQLLYPSNRRRPGGRKTRELRISRRELKAQNEQIEDLVPIRLDIDWEKVKIRDTFTWNLHDRVVSPDLFAEKLVEDMGLPLESCGPLVRMISQSIQEQIADYYPQVYVEEAPLDPHLPYSAYKNDEMRILVKLNITIGQHTLVDQFEWDINDPLNSPEEFALRMTNDLSLSGEFTTAIAHSIREQAQLFTRSLYIVAHPFDGRSIEDPDLKSAFLPSPLPSAFRPFQAAKEYTPYLYELNEAELERTEVSISREQRRQKRSVNRRGGPALPDLKDRQRTIRTMVVSSVLPNSAPSIEESNVFKRSGANRHRRAALGQRDGAEDSEDSDSDDSSIGSPAIGPHLAQGTARTRGMRAAVPASHSALRASLGHSATPEPSHQHETRVNSRRRKSTDEPELIVKLKIPRDKFRQFLRDLRVRSRPQSTSNISGSTPGPHSSHGGAQTHTPKAGTRHQSGQRRVPSHIGVIDAPHPPQPGVPGPPPPAWLVNGLTRLNRSYPTHSFEAVMRYSAVDAETLVPINNTNATHPGQKLKYQYLPRIRCHDCPGKLYTPGPAMTVDNFEVHLKNRQHKERVEERLARIAAADATARANGEAGAGADGASTSAPASSSTPAPPSNPVNT
ncbi:SWI SNF, matrix associated, actin dependent regulator of chromatin, sub b, member 1 [Monascus purpureus]|uniref:SWI SNF, matrix associated, actin dependent regulator of chromatin, sub b, member 1 n=1 Tax=Monascus purpureus TaxID=5098 RepID=A0A507R4Y6_MONPU|nr:SWI SNF, matrix associated, actin dependent regulator of chromatin, sub b, member 1 [Monascus purpureus]BDD55310.1 hypothetical protein MAP00_000846 [Monascus purpureus]